jgi:LacI family transcriptional regulator
VVASTINDVARAAGVSIKTVSRVLNGEPYVREETRLKVTEAAERLNYRPNISARALAGGRAYLVGLYYDNPSPGYLSEIQLGAISACRRAGYHLLVEELALDEPDLASRVEALSATVKTDGAILSPPVCDNIEVLDALDRAGVRYVRIAPVSQLERAPYVYMDDRRAAYEMTGYLQSLGHREIGFVIGHPTHASAHLRHEGYLAAMRDGGCTVRDEWVRQGEFSFRSGLGCGEAMLQGKARPTAIFASNDDMALGVMTAAHRLGLALPQDLSVVGFDDSPSAQVIWPQLTTVRQPTVAMAATAVEMVIAKAGRSRAEDGPDARLLDFELVLRESAAAR